MKIVAAFLAGILLAAAGTAGADGGHLRDLLNRVGIVETQQAEQDNRIAALEHAVDSARRDAAWALENSWNEARQLRRCGMKPTIQKQNQCFYRLF